MASKITIRFFFFGLYMLSICNVNPQEFVNKFDAVENDYQKSAIVFLW